MARMDGIVALTHPSLGLGEWDFGALLRTNVGRDEEAGIPVAP